VEEGLPIELRARLDQEPPRLVLEYLAHRLFLVEDSVRLEVLYQQGRFVKAWIHHGPIGATRLGELVLREAVQAVDGSTRARRGSHLLPHVGESPGASCC
jgi:hypothetical protein